MPGLTPRQALRLALRFFLPRSCRCRGSFRHFARHWFEHRPDVLRQNLVAGCVRVNSVGKVQRRIAAYTLQKVRHQSGMVFRRQFIVHLAEILDVAIAAVIRKLQPGDNQLHARVRRSDFINDLLQIPFDLLDRDSAKGIIDSELEDKDIDSVLQMRR